MTTLYSVSRDKRNKGPQLEQPRETVVMMTSSANKSWSLSIDSE